jgi:hypothetical protein
MKSSGSRFDFLFIVANESRLAPYAQLSER